MQKLDEETVKKLCLHMRNGKAKGIWKLQCYFCNKFAQKNPKNYCFYSKEDFTGCNIINGYIRKQEAKGLSIFEN